jgi:hypothetical protein
LAGVAIAVVLASHAAVAQGAPRGAERASNATAVPPGDERLDEARVRYERGVQLYSDGSAEGALAEFERAYQLSPTYRLLYNIGLIRSQLNDYADALKAFQGYLLAGGGEIASARRAEVERMMSSLKSKVGVVQVVSGATGAEVSVDDVVVGKVPLSEPLVLNPGRRRIAIARGASTRSRVVAVVGQDTVRVDLNLDPPAPLPMTTRAPSTPSRAPAYVTASLAAALGIGAAVTGVLSLNAMRDLDRERDRSPSTRERLDDASSKMRTLALVTDILAGSMVVAGGVAVYFSLRNPSKEAGRLQPEARVGVGLSGLRFEGRF